jgi:hypothetical protein
MRGPRMRGTATFQVVAVEGDVDVDVAAAG